MLGMKRTQAGLAAIAAMGLTSAVGADSLKIGYVAGSQEPQPQAVRWLQQQEGYDVHTASALDQLVANSYDVLWWNATNSASLDPSATSSETREAVLAFVEEGGGLLMTGYATQYAANLGLTAAPTTVIREPASSGAWGFAATCPNHPIFRGLPQPVITLSEGSQVENLIAWWDNPADFGGYWLADTESSIGKVAIGELRHGRGKVITVGGGAFDWQLPSEENTEVENLRTLTDRMLGYLAEPAETPLADSSLAAHWDFEEPHGSPHAVEHVFSVADELYNNFDRPERYELGDGSNALVLDGFSTYLKRADQCAPLLAGSATWSAWFAPRAYPPQTAPLFQQISEGAGYSFELTRYGQWGLRVNIGGIWHALWAPQVLPKEQWNHVAATVDAERGIGLYLNGRQVAQQDALWGSMHLANDHPFLIGRSASTDYVAEIFPTALLNGLLDEARVYRRALSEGQIAELARGPHAADEIPAVFAASDRFAHDHHRPHYHPLPESDWTNEPHGFIQMPDGKYHLFYQKNPAGPYWQFIHWGHMTSDDLLAWKNERIPIAPEPGIDQEGIWSGHAINDDGQLRLVYTAVDGRRATIAFTDAVDHERTVYEKFAGNPVIDGRPKGKTMQDFRDPFLWEEDGKWNLIIGAGVPNQGGVMLHYEASDPEGPWAYTGDFFQGTRAESGDFWEMPLYIPFEKERAFFGVSELPAINEYWIGTHEDGRFHAKSGPHHLEVINHLLSPTVTKTLDGRWLAIGIVPETRSSREQLDAGWAHLYSIPREWTLHPEEDVLLQNPARELRQLRGRKTTAADISLPDGEWVALEGMAGSVAELVLDMATDDASFVDVAVRRSPDEEEQTLLTFDLQKGELAVDRRQQSNNSEVQRDVRKGAIPLYDREDALRLHLLLDNSVVEGFINEGHAFATRVYPEREDSTQFAIRARGGNAQLQRADHWELRAPDGEMETVQARN